MIEPGQQRKGKSGVIRILTQVFPNGFTFVYASRCNDLGVARIVRFEDSDFIKKEFPKIIK